MHRSRAVSDRSAISHNCGVLRRAAGGAGLCAVVKANGYGHGVEAVAEAAVAGGATWLGVASASEALELRALGRAEPLLVMGAVSAMEAEAVIRAGCDLAVWSREALDTAASAAAGAGTLARVHVKLDTGMGRLGTRDPAFAMGLLERAVASSAVEPAGLMTHFATADEDDDAFLRDQLSRFGAFVGRSREVAPDAVAHAANSAATLRLPAAALDMVRCGVALYGMDPFGRDPSSHGLRPALEWTSTIAAVKQAQPGDSVGYGRRFVAASQTLIATVPVGYADGYRRGLSGSAEVLVGGQRRPVVGTVSMDNITVDLGAESTARVGDEVVLVGERGDDRVLIEELAALAGTINYEIATGIGGRTERITAGGP